MNSPVKKPNSPKTQSVSTYRGRSALRQWLDSHVSRKYSGPKLHLDKSQNPSFLITPRQPSGYEKRFLSLAILLRETLTSLRRNLSTTLSRLSRRKTTRPTTRS